MQQQCALGDIIPIQVNATDINSNVLNLTGYTCTLVVYNASGFRKTYSMDVQGSGANALTHTAINTGTDFTPGPGDYALSFQITNGTNSFTSQNPMNLRVIPKP